ncbi:MAG: DUF882 domain-containing protein [Nitrospirae bacterium]|nr:DUF882 domain-containing protein [Nitrospirota bacterium]MDA8340535.1 DUF882 domain-containing protein [Nitrospiraceae bacterium]
MISRRGFIKAIAAGMAILPFKKALASSKTERMLNLHNTHTGESVNIKYYDSGIYDPDALNEINYLLRDHYTNEVKAIDVKALDLLCNIKDIFGKDKQVKIISGYRSFEYNEYLRSLGRRVSKNSLHLHGLAIDFVIPGVSNYELFRIAKSFGVGGVGHYPEFVHIDTGRIRYW